MLRGFAREGAVHQFIPPLSLGMGVGVLQGPGEVKGLQQECERHRKSGALVRSEKNVSVATDVLLSRVSQVLPRVLGKRSIAQLSKQPQDVLNSEYFCACSIAQQNSC